MNIQFDEKIPIYIQIIDKIKRDIAIGKLKGGDKLPSVREMAESLRVNPNTIQRVYQELERQEITYTQRGMGSYITHDKSKFTAIKRKMAEELIVSFVKGMNNIGFSSNEIISSIENYIEGGRVNE